MNDLLVDLKYQRKGFDFDVQFGLNKSQITVVLGASGSGKSTLLRLLAGLEKPTAGKIHCHGDTWFDSAQSVYKTPQHRAVGFVFQDYALFENMTIAENIAFGAVKHQRNKIVNELLEQLKLVPYKDKYPSQLSGGQKQRVALGRALAIKPALLLLDEPLSAIDHSLRKQLQQQLKEYIKVVDCPVILVTHDLTEARFMADNLVVMSAGKVTRQGIAHTVFNNPVNKQAADTLGWQNYIPVNSSDDGWVMTNWGKFLVETLFVPQAEWIAIRPEKIRFGNVKYNSLPAKLVDVADYGAYKEFLCQVDASLFLTVHRPTDEPAPPVNSMVNLHLSPLYLSMITAQKNNASSIDLIPSQEKSAFINNLSS